MYSAVLKPLTFIHSKNICLGPCMCQALEAALTESEVIQFPVPRSTKHSER